MSQGILQDWQKPAGLLAAFLRSRREISDKFAHLLKWITSHVHDAISYKQFRERGKEKDENEGEENKEKREEKEMERKR